MNTPESDIENLISQLVAVMAQPAEGDADPNTSASMRERFFELMVLSLGNLYGKTPVAATLYDRTILKRVTEGMDDNEAGKLSLRAEDWLRLEGLVRGQEGQKAYYLGRASLSVLSTTTSAGTLGEVLEKIQAQYAASMPTQNMRQITRKFGAYFLAQLGTG